MSKKIKSLVLGIAVCVGSVLTTSAAGAAGGEPVMVKDIADGKSCESFMPPFGDPVACKSEPRSFLNLGNITLFTADDGVHGRELWKTDGTDEGTELVLDLNPRTDCNVGFMRTGPCNGLIGMPNLPFGISMGNAVYFEGNDGVNGYELWKTDGTPEGTVLVKDIRPGDCTSNNETIPCSSDALPLAVLGDKLVLSADDGVNGKELWLSDGTREGTQLLRDINNGKNCGQFSMSGCAGLDMGPAGVFVVIGTEGYFVASDGVVGRELWKTDGTEAGTQMVHNFNGQQDSMNVADIFLAGNTVFFGVDDGEHGRELWKTDGTESGTELVRDINSKTGCNVRGQENKPCESYPRFVEAVGNTIYFTADDGTTGFELWKSDGTENGTVQVKDVNPATDCSFAPPFIVLEPCSGGIRGIGSIGSTLFFSADDGANGRELWETDGTPEGTKIVVDINSNTDCVSNFPADSDLVPCSGFSNGPSPAKIFGDALFFIANDGTTGDELWKSDGTEGGTQLVADINLGTECKPMFPPNAPVGPCSGTDPMQVTFGLSTDGSTLYLTADDGSNGLELWKYDLNGSSSGTVYDVMYEYNGATGGNSTESSSFTTGESALTLPTPTKTGYRFAGWYSEAGFVTKVGIAGASYSPTDDVTLYAKWTAETYLVTYNYNSATGGNSTATRSYTTGGTAITLPTPTKTGYRFAGWYSEAGFVTKIGDAGALYRPTAAGTVYAKWTALTYVVTYNYNSATGGNSSASASYTVGGTAVTLPTPTRTGFTFAGWYSNAGLSTSIGAAGASYRPTAAVTAYAKWLKKADATTKPSVTGTPTTGKTLTVNKGVWVGTPTPAFTYQWYSCSARVSAATQVVPSTCSKITNATATTVVLATNTKNKFITIKVTGTSAGTTATSWVAASTSVIR